MTLLLLSFLFAGRPTAPRWAPEVVRVEGIAPERVQLSVSVLDSQGEPVTGLTRTDFSLDEDGRPQDLLDFGRESERQDRPLSVVFLVDRSGSIGRQMGKWREACVGLMSALRPIDEVRLATFTSDVEIVQDFTADVHLMDSAVGKLDQSGGGTDIFASVDATLHDLRDRPGRKVIFLLTDGLDTLRAGVWSTDNDPYLRGLVRQAVGFQTTIVTILPGPTARPYLAAQDLAVQTGGWWLYPSDDLPGLVRKLGERLLESYYIAYDSPRKPGDQRRRRVEVKVTRPGLAGLQVRTIAGQFGDTPLFEALAGDLSDGEEDERVRAAVALGSLRDPRGEPLLMRGLKDESSRVRAAAAESLGRRGTVSTVRPLARLLRDDAPEVRSAAIDALKSLLRAARDPSLQAKILEALETVE
jgi:VWFA-related protein